MIDTHTHLYLEEFNPDGDMAADAPRGAAAVKRAIEAGVAHLIFPNVDLESYKPMMNLHNYFPEETSASIGLHPTSVGENYKADLEATLELLAHNTEAVAIGEVGMDLYWDKTYRREQMEVFRRQIEAASQRGLPVIIHCREALDDTLGVLREFGAELPQVVFHSFTGSIADVEAIRSVTDARFGINGVVTYKSAGALREALPAIGLDRMMLETDSPYLAPVPKRGRRNESAYILHVADCIAATLGTTREVVEKGTDATAREFFRL